MDTITRRDRPRKYVFLNKSAGSRRNLAIIECDPDHTPKMIRETRKGNARIIDAIHCIYVGKYPSSRGYMVSRGMAIKTARLNGHERGA